MATGPRASERTSERENFQRFQRVLEVFLLKVFRGFQRFSEIFQRFSEVLSETLSEALRGSQSCCP